MKEDGHMWAHGGPARSSAEGQQTGETRENQSRKDVKITFQHVSLWNKEFIGGFLIERVHFQARVFLSPGGIFCSSPHPIILKASFLSAKWHANGPVFPLLQSPITAVWWTHLRLSGCYRETSISCAEQAGTNHAFGFSSNPVCFTFHTTSFRCYSHNLHWNKLLPDL